MLFTGWILFNTLTPKKMHFDPYPFEFVVLGLSLEAIFLSFFFIIITQRRQGEMDQRRNHLDLQINLLAKQENTKVLWTLKRMADHMGVDLSEDPDLQILDEATEPEKLIEQIDKSMKESRAWSAHRTGDNGSSFLSKIQCLEKMLRVCLNRIQPPKHFFPFS